MKITGVIYCNVLPSANENIESEYQSQELHKTRVGKDLQKKLFKGGLQTM